MVASKYNICDMENNSLQFNYVQCLNVTPMWKGWFMPPMEYSPNGKDMMAMEYMPKFDSPNGKGMVLWKILFQNGNSHVKR